MKGGESANHTLQPKNEIVTMKRKEENES